LNFYRVYLKLHFSQLSFQFSYIFVDATGYNTSFSFCQLLCVHGAKLNAYIASDALKPDSQDTKAKVQRHWTHCPVPWRYLSQTVAKFCAHRGTPACIAKQQKGRKRQPEEKEVIKLQNEQDSASPRLHFVIRRLCAVTSLALYDEIAIFAITNINFYSDIRKFLKK